MQSFHWYKSRMVLTSEEEVINLACILLTSNYFTYKQS